MTKTPQQIKNEVEKGLKVTPQIELHEIIECEGNFFYIDKIEVNHFHYKGESKHIRYFLKTIVRKEKIEHMKRILHLK